MAEVDNEAPEKLGHNHPLRGKFGPNLVDLWDRCNAIVLSWIMNRVSLELLSEIVYSSNASAFDSLAPIPGCDCEKSREFVVFMERLKLLQFLMGLNESHEQARSQLLMMTPAPSVNKAYSMMMERESQRAIAYTSPVENSNLTVLVSARGGFQQRPKKNFNLVCDYCKYKGHTRENCFKLVGYPADFKHKKKGNAFPTANFQLILQVITVEETMGRGVNLSLIQQLHLT
ncbi:hypothetical protein A4A49_62463 [Nicotiana attenuata]|uniref:Retrotransposon gag domain-containing protein n=1 Tax=Nicotiana attenuata TaxID=49451 RepID=A0A1J6HZL3_NICAT|nr:hypothetical protein A4A49_62463 [Nicotiana attenuata]